MTDHDDRQLLYSARDVKWLIEERTAELRVEVGRLRAEIERLQAENTRLRSTWTPPEDDTSPAIFDAPSPTPTEEP